MVVVRRADSPTTEAPFGFGRVNEDIGCDIVAEIDDLESGAFEHDADEVLADIVQITLDGADHDLAVRRHLSSEEQRLQEVDAGVHGPRCKEQLGQEDLVRAEALAHHVHPGHQPVIEDLRRRNTGINRLPGELGDLLVISPL